jgi:hypothetical protein
MTRLHLKNRTSHHKRIIVKQNIIFHILEITKRAKFETTTILEKQRLSGLYQKNAPPFMVDCPHHKVISEAKN